MLDINPFGVPGWGGDLHQTSYKMFKWKLAVRRFHPQESVADGIVKNYERLRLGMTRTEVEQMLGRPDYEADTNDNRMPRCYGWFWTYHLADVSAADLESYSGPKLEVSFDSADKAYYFHPTGIPGLADKGKARFYA
ncbi:MAG TPA: hypothetical protein VGR50_08100 [Terriglobales bacterium]|nr:hypothetical protein [Terriglobales bacterium]